MGLPIFDTKSSGDAFTNQLTIPHTCSGAKRLLLVGAVQNANGVTGVTYNGVAMTLLPLSTWNNPGGSRGCIYYMINPPDTGPHNIVVTYGGNGSSSACGASYHTVNQVVALGTANTQVGDTAAQPALVVACDATDLVFDFMGNRWGAATYTVGALQTQRHNQSTSAGDDCGCAVSDEPGQNPSTMQWTLTAGQWGIAGVAIKPHVATGGPRWFF